MSRVLEVQNAPSKRLSGATVRFNMTGKLVAPGKSTR